MERGTDADRLDRVLGIGTLLVWATYKVYVWLPGVRGLEYSLPLQFCDITGLLPRWHCSPVGDICGRFSTSGGIGFSILAFVAPDLHEGLGSGRFWLFWLSHSAIVGSALYDLAGRGFRPAWRNWRIAVAAARSMLPLWRRSTRSHISTTATSARSVPGQPPILDAMGPWPWRVAIQAVLAILALACCCCRGRFPGG